MSFCRESWAHFVKGSLSCNFNWVFLFSRETWSNKQFPCYFCTLWKFLILFFPYFPLEWYSNEISFQLGLNGRIEVWLMHNRLKLIVFTNYFTAFTGKKGFVALLWFRDTQPLMENKSWNQTRKSSFTA